MNPAQLQGLKRRLEKLWLLSPERLWLLSTGLRRRGHWVTAFWIKQLNTLLYHNSLAPQASVSPDVRLGHNSIGIVITGQVTIGSRVMIWQNTTLTAGRRARASGRASGAIDGDSARQPLPVKGAASRIVVEDNVRIGANCVVIAPRGQTLRIGRGARIGAGTVVTKDVPPRATVVGQPPRVLLRRPAGRGPESSAGRGPESSAERRAESPAARGPGGSEPAQSLDT